MSLKERLLQLKFEYRSLVAREPWLAPLHQLVIWWTQYKMQGHIDPRECRVDTDTEFVLDGFQGTANSFATRAFKSAQNDPVRIAHHLHSPAQIIKAVTLDLPTLVTIRNPENAVASLISRWPYVTPRQGLRSYIRFYQKIEPYKEKIILSPFSQTTQNLDGVFSAVNARFGTDFAVFEHTRTNVHAIRDPEAQRSDAEIRRQSRKAQAKEELTQAAYQPLLRQARTLHRRLEAYGIGQLALMGALDGAPPPTEHRHRVPTAPRWNPPEQFHRTAVLRTTAAS